MFGYTVKYSVDIIEELIDNGHFIRHKGDLQEAINDLNIHFEYGNVSKRRYEYLMNKLKTFED